MKTISSLIIFSFLILSKSVCAQNLDKFLILYGLPSYKIDSSPNPDMNLKKAILSDDLTFEYKIRKGKIFNNIELTFSAEKKELDAIQYNSDNGSIGKNSEKIISDLNNSLGSPQIIYNGDMVERRYIDSNIMISFILQRFGGEDRSRLLVRHMDFIKLTYKYDEFDKTTNITAANIPIYYSSAEGKDYGIEFIGLLPSKKIALRVSSQSAEWKFIKSVQLLLFNGTVYNMELQTSRGLLKIGTGSLTNEKGIVIIPDDVASALSVNVLSKIRVNGQSTGIIEVHPDLYKSFLKIYQAINQ